ncbi:MAG: ABC transporter permease [Chloroflexi bacterium]|nr:ABC transporter permease [Chloroflexota bacterium]MCC6894819.1 ABC transporter permease [Anaerolineae bacterium]
MLGRYVIQRLILTIPMMLGISLVLFLIYNLVQVDPLVMIVGERALDKPEIVEAAKAKWGLDRPVWEQYITYVVNMARGDFGNSFLTKRPVTTDLFTFLPATVELAMSSLLFAVIFGVPLGILAGVKYRSLFDRGVWFVSLLNASLPPFWTGLIFLTIFYFNLGIAPGPGRLDPRMTDPAHVTGLFTVDSILSGNWSAFTNSLHHLVLPTLILGGFTLALVVRVTRAAIIEEMRRDYVRTARGKGLSERAVIIRHALRNVLIPLVTILGLAFAGLLSGAVMTETVFDWPGLGQYLVKAAVNLDYPAIQGGTLLIAAIYVLTNLVVDILYGVLDPRVRHE